MQRLTWVGDGTCLRSVDQSEQIARYRSSGLFLSFSRIRKDHTAIDVPADQLDLANLRAHLPRHGLGAPIQYAPVIPSTNSQAMTQIAQGIAHGTLVLTDAQPAGRGRQGRSWVTLPGQQILMSLVMHPTCAPHWLVLATALAAVAALESNGVPPERVGIKWPNDIMVDERKVAGILIETSTTPQGSLVAVIGIGMNVNGSLAPWPEIAQRATTLADAMGHPHSREAIIVDLLDALGREYQALTTSATPTEALLERWRARLLTLGRRATVHQTHEQVSGFAEDVTGDGALILRHDDGTRHLITWGDVEMGS